MEEAKAKGYQSKKLGITIGFCGHNSMNDGLVVNAMTNCPSTQACPLCHKKQSQFNKDNVDFEIVPLCSPFTRSKSGTHLPD